MSEQNNAYSVCGTPEYLAPEIIKKSGHGKAVDWWCLGSILYELSHGLPPFYCKNRAELFDKIKNTNPYIPSQWSENLKDIVYQLMEKDPHIRIKNAQRIKQHPWFADINWDKLLQRQIKPPFIPKINHEVDVSNFDREFTECEIVSPGESPSAGNDLAGFSFERSPTGDNPLKQAENDCQAQNDDFVMEIQL